MTINDRHQIKFDVTKEYSSWESEDKLVKLFISRHGPRSWIQEDSFS